jgi:hypothetical protein
MKGRKLLAAAFIAATYFSTAHAAWEKVRMPEVNEGIIEMEFANAGLGFALVAEEYSPYNFFVYRNGAWTLERLPGMFLGYAEDISLLNSGYGWVVGIHGGMDWALYTARSYGGGRWEKTSNPYQTGNYPGDYAAVSVAAVEDVWVLNRDVNGFLHYKDGVWEELRNVLPAELGVPREVCFVNENDGWVSGSGGFAHYVNGEWKYVPGRYAYRLDFTAPDDGWAVDYIGAGAVLHCNGSSWQVAAYVPGYSAYDVSFCDRNNGWALFNASGKPIRLFKYNSGIWREVKPPDDNSIGYPCSLSALEARFLGSRFVKSQSRERYTWHWDTEPNVEPTSLGHIKAIFK